MIFLEGKTSGNSEMKSGVSEFVMEENRVLDALLHLRVIPFSGKEIMAFPQSIIALLAIWKGIPRKMSLLSKEHTSALVFCPVSFSIWIRGWHLELMVE